MKYILTLLVTMFSLSMIAGPTMRLEGNDGYFIEATMMDGSNQITATTSMGVCNGTITKDMSTGRLIVIFEDTTEGCSDQNLTIFFSQEAYAGLYLGKVVQVGFESGMFGNVRKMATAKIIRM